MKYLLGENYKAACHFDPREEVREWILSPRRSIDHALEFCVERGNIQYIDHYTERLSQIVIVDFAPEDEMEFIIRFSEYKWFHNMKEWEKTGLGLGRYSLTNQ